MFAVTILLLSGMTAAQAQIADSQHPQTMFVSGGSTIPFMLLAALLIAAAIVTFILRSKKK
jgi:hypothetical protein